MVQITLQSLLESGAHFGHKKQSLNKNMTPYVFLNNNHVSLIDLRYTVAFLKKSQNVLQKVLSSGKKILFVSTRPQMAEIVKQAAIAAESPYVVHKWLGGMLTNSTTVYSSLNKMVRYEKTIEKNQEAVDSRYTKKELLSLQRKVDKIKINLEGLKNIKVSDIGLVIVFDIKKDFIALQEAIKCKIPVLGVVDTNNEPTLVDYIIPANDDSVKTIDLFVSFFSDLIKNHMNHELQDKRVIKSTNFNNKKIITQHSE